MSFQYLSPPLGGFLAFLFPAWPPNTSLHFHPRRKKKQESEADSCLQAR